MIVFPLTNNLNIMKLHQFAQMRGFESAYKSGNPELLEHVLNSDQGDEIREKFLTKRLQFDCLPQLHADVEQVCSLLECSKRQFLEMAVQEAIAKAEGIFMASFKQVHGLEFCDVYAPGATVEA